MQIIHGDNTIISYKRLTEILATAQSNGFKTVFLEQSVGLTDLRQELSPQDLFGNTNFIVINNLLSSAKSAKKEKLLDFLESADTENLVLYETKSINLNSLKRFSKAKIETFKVESTIFKFLDQIKPKNTAQLLRGYAQLVTEGCEPEYVFAMVLRQVRLLIQIKTNFSRTKVSPYAKKYLVQQSSLFSLNQLLLLHASLYEIEKGVKSGSSPVSFDNLFENFLQNI